MAGVLLDTDVFSYILGRRPEADCFEPLIRGRRLYLSFFSVGELLFGAYKDNWGERRTRKLRDAIRRVEIIHSNDEVVERFALLVSECVRNGHPLGQKEHRGDAWIAAVASSHGLPLATNNEKHFVGAPGLDVLQSG